MEALADRRPHSVGRRDIDLAEQAQREVRAKLRLRSVVSGLSESHFVSRRCLMGLLLGPIHNWEEAGRRQEYGG